MKKTIWALGAMAVMIMGMTSCSDPVSKGQQGKYDDESKQLGKDMTELLGIQLGEQDRVGLDNDQLAVLRTRLDSYHSENFDRDAFLNGFKKGLNMDTTDFAYLYGLREGMMVRAELDQMAYEFDVPLNVQDFIKSYSKAFNDTLTDDERQDIDKRMGDMQMTMMTRRQVVAEKRRAAQIAANDSIAKEYTKKLLAEGYKQSPSGLVYKIVKKGTGETAKLNDQVLVTYTGKHINGEEFDSNVGNPFEMSPADVVQGYREAMMMLGKGGKILIALPGKLAYGDKGEPRAGITPNEMLLFELEVHDITPAPAAENADDDNDIEAQRAYAQQYIQQLQAAQAAAQQAGK